MSTAPSAAPTLTEVLLARGYEHRPAGHGAHDIVRISDGVVVTTLKAHEAWDWVHAFDRQIAKAAKAMVFVVVDVTTNRIVDRFANDADAAKKAAERPRDWLAVHESHLASMGVDASILTPKRHRHDFRDGDVCSTCDAARGAA